MLRLFVLLLWLLLFFRGTDLNAQSSAREHDVKATLLFNFCHFIQWPEAGFRSPDSPFVIGILGTDPFGDFLDALVRQERTHGRSIVVRRFARPDDVSEAHVLFIANSEQSRVAAVLSTLRGRPTLTVGESDDRGFTRRGVMIGFATERDNVRLRINLDQTRAAGLTISAKLLRLAQIVRTEK